MHKDSSQQKLVRDIEGLANASLVAPLLNPAGIACMADLFAEYEAEQKKTLATLDEDEEHPEDFMADDYHEGYAVYGPLFPHEEGGPVPVLFEEEDTAKRLVRALNRLTPGHVLYHEAWAAGEHICLESRKVRST